MLACKGSTDGIVNIEFETLFFPWKISCQYILGLRDRLDRLTSHEWIRVWNRNHNTLVPNHHSTWNVSSQFAQARQMNPRENVIS